MGLSMRKGIRWVIVLLVILLSVGTIGMVMTTQMKAGRDAVPDSGASEQSSQQEEQESSVPEESSQPLGAVNPLTGLPIEKGREDGRPVAVMVNNIKKAQPLLGVQQADVMYECLVEGGITRIMAVYQDHQAIPVVGSIRSARPYYIHLASSLDAIYVHIGGSNQAKELLRTGLVEDYDLMRMEQYMWRDPQRRADLGYEHSAVTSGQRLMEALDEKETRTQRKDGVEGLAFSQNSPVQQGKDAPGVSVNFSSYKSTDFTYDEERGGYLVSQFDKPMMDGDTGGQVCKENVLVLRVNTYPIDEYGLMAMDLAGSGAGYYLNGGKRLDIRWSRKSEDSPFVLTTSDGGLLPMLPGQIYVCCVPLEARVSFS